MFFCFVCLLFVELDPLINKAKCEPEFIAIRFNLILKVCVGKAQKNSYLQFMEGLYLLVVKVLTVACFVPKYRFQIQYRIPYIMQKFNGLNTQKQKIYILTNSNS